MKISMIAAMSRNRVIGKDNDIPWHLPDDFKFFKDTTKHHHVIMGRKNYESLPHKFRPLPDRTNIIITRQDAYPVEGATVVASLEAALEISKKAGEEEAFIIGGGEIYRLGLAIAETIYLTEIDGEIDGDVFFPEFDKEVWREVARSHHPTDDRHKFAFDYVTYEKI
ncbi:MAG: dihydrofolate reductase [Cytophagales bacterium]|nr:dihydrofolate reductase [Cytophagales bacterium]